MSDATRRVATVALATLIGATLAAGSVAVATGSSSTIHACETARTHVLHLGTCKAGERKVSWSAVGPRGPQGPAGSAATPPWQVIVNPDGTTQYVHPGITVTTTSTAGQYKITWTGIGSLAAAYCQALGAQPATLSNESADKTGSGQVLATILTHDEIFYCQIVPVVS